VSHAIPDKHCGCGAQGRVIFDHQLHASKGYRCNDCHTDYKGTGKHLFETRKRGLISLVDHETGVKCSACHNGKDEFDACARCHYKIGGF
jgi:c(7)-type cytochrome triheme protein